MPYSRRFSTKMADYDIGDDVSVVDVYDIASDIGKECEVIIDKFGADAVTSLLPKVINALELLENLAIKNEKENSAVQELTAKISQLENDKVEKAEYRQRFEKEIEAIEEQWRTESADLVSAVSRLQDENKRLRRSVNGAPDGAPPSPAREQDAEVLHRLTTTAERQRNTLREQEHLLQEKQQIIESLTSQVDRYANVGKELRRKQKQLQNQIRTVCEERAELGAIVQTQQKELTTLQQTVKGDSEQKCVHCAALASEGPLEECDRPLFSSRELRAILHERNELKQRLQDAEEQLVVLRHGAESPDTSSSCGPSSSVTGADEEEAPVQGPLPYEPDDAPWKRQRGGIRKFFRKLFAESDVAMGSFPKRSLSSLASKMATGTVVTATTTTYSDSASLDAARWHYRKPNESVKDLREELTSMLDHRGIEVETWLGSRETPKHNLNRYTFSDFFHDFDEDDYNEFMQSVDDLTPETQILSKTLTSRGGIQLLHYLRRSLEHISIANASGRPSGYNSKSGSHVSINTLTLANSRGSHFERSSSLEDVSWDVPKRTVDSSVGWRRSHEDLPTSGRILPRLKFSHRHDRLGFKRMVSIDEEDVIIPENNAIIERESLVMTNKMNNSAYTFSEADSSPLLCSQCSQRILSNDTTANFSCKRSWFTLVRNRFESRYCETASSSEVAEAIVDCNGNEVDNFPHGLARSVEFLFGLWLRHFKH